MLRNDIPTDHLGRRFKKLRVSLLDSCNFKCSYCMPPGPEFIKHNTLLEPAEIQKIVSQLIHYGIEEVRLTGGEPLLRRDLADIVSRLSELDLKKLAMTTNAFGLSQKLAELKRAGLQSFNISLDSLKANTFREITKVDGFKDVYRGILEAQDRGFQVKVNTVLMRGVNDHELWDFIEFSQKTGIEVRFLEVMKIGVMVYKYDELFICADEMIQRMQERFQPLSIPVPWDSTSFKYKLSNGAVIGFIASESKPFCGSCSRIRLGAKGKLFTCLMSDYGTDIKGLNEDQLGAVLSDLLGHKPTGRIEKIERPMYQIGG